jgi:CDP-4-dehydro-6-deoxyglucose reductase, E1
MILRNMNWERAILSDLILSETGAQERENLRGQILSLVKNFVDAEITSEFRPGEDAIPVSGKVLGSDEIQYMVEAALDGWLTTGRFNASFESGLANFLNVKHLRTVNSGSSANLVAFSSLTSPKLGERAVTTGDEVITVAAGFPTTVNPILQNGAVPVFLDIELGTYNIQADQIESAITKKTKAIMLAHTLGNPFDLQTVVTICKKHNLWLVEDTCDALGSTYAGRPVGSFGDLGTLSFYPAHHITMGEGGAVFTNSGRLMKIAESFRDWGRDCYCPPGQDDTCGNRYDWTSRQLGGALPDGYDHKYIYSHVGYNLKITDMQAACGLGQLARLGSFIDKRKQNFDYLKSGMSDLGEHMIFPNATHNSEPSWFGFAITLTSDKADARQRLITYLERHKIATRLLFGGNLINQPYFSGKNYRVHHPLSNTDKVLRNTFWIGVFPGLEIAHLDYVISVFHDYFRTV